MPERKGQKCRVLVRGKMNSILVEFEDGEKVVTSRYAVRRRKKNYDGILCKAIDRPYEICYGKKDEKRASEEPKL